MEEPHPVLQWIPWVVNCCRWLVKVANTHWMRWSKSTWIAFLKVTDLPRFTIIPSGDKISMFIPLYRTHVFLAFDVVLEMIFVFLECSCKLCAVVAEMRSSSMVVVCWSVPLMRRMSPVNLRLGKIAPRSCSTSLNPWVVYVPHLCLWFHDVFVDTSL